MLQSIKELSLKSWPPGSPTEAQYPLGKVPLHQYLRIHAQEQPENAKPDPHKGEVIKAFIILKPDQSASAEEIRAWSKQNMSSYKVPAVIEFVDSFPMSGAGKVLRRLLEP